MPIVQESVWALGPGWTGAEYLAPPGFDTPDRPTRSQSLYRICYPAHVRGTDSDFNVHEVFADVGWLEGTATSEDLFVRVSFWVFGIGLEKLTSVITYRGISAVYSSKNSITGRICAKVMNATCNSPMVFHCSHQETHFCKRFALQMKEFVDTVILTANCCRKVDLNHRQFEYFL